MRNTWICIALAAAMLAAYWPVHNFGFVNYDDNFYVYENPRVLSGISTSNLAWAFTTYETSNYAPLTWISYQFDASVFHARPEFMHVENVVWHIAATILLFLLCAKFIGGVWPSAMAAALFALHPVHVESVAWISERKDVLSTTFFLLAVWSYCRYASMETHRRTCSYFAMVFFFATGLLCKSMLVTFPFVLLLLDFWPMRRLGLFHTESQIAPRFKSISVSMAVREKIPLTALSVIASILTYKAQASIEASLVAIPWTLRVQNAALSYCQYLGNFFWPANLLVLYPYRWKISPVESIFSASLIIGLVLIVIARFKRQPHLCTGFFWFLGTLVPVIGVVQVGAQSMADRYLYIPSIGLGIAMVWMLWGTAAVAKFPRIATMMALMLLGLLGALTRHQVWYWKDTDSLFGHVSIVLNGASLTEVRSGVEAAQRGDDITAERYFRMALAQDPADFSANFDLGNLLLKNHPEQAVLFYEGAARTDPRKAELQCNWGVALLKMNDMAGSFQHFRTAESLDAGMYAPHFNLGRLFAMSGNPSRAREEFQLALRAKPGDIAATRGLESINTKR